MHATSYNLNEFTDDDHTKDRIVAYILSIGSSYPSEVARHLLINSETTQALMLQLLNNGILQRLTFETWDTPTLIRARIKDMWEQGIFGYDNFIKRSWFIVTKKGLMEFATKHKGEHRQANIGYLEYLDKDEVTNAIQTA